MKKILTACLFAGILAGCSVPAASQSSLETETGAKNESQSSSKESEKEDSIDIPAVRAASSKISLDQQSQPVLIGSGGTYDISGTGKGIIVDAAKQTVTLRLDGAVIENSSIPAIYVKKAGKVIIETVKDSSLSISETQEYDVLDACIYSKADLEIKGSGTLTIASGYGHGIKAKDNVVIDGASLSITAVKDGIHINEDGTFKSGTFSIQAGDEAVQSEQSLFFKNGNYTITSTFDGLRAEEQLIIEDGTYAIQSGSEGMESKNSLAINGGTIDIDACDDAINAAKSLVINDGKIRAVSSGNDGIDSNGDLIINGGTVYASGLKTPETSFDTDNTPFEIHGGTIIGAGSMVTYPTSLDQPILYIGAEQNVTSIKVMKGSDTILEYSLQVGQSVFGNTNLIVSSSRFEMGQTYDVYVNDSLLETVTFDEQSLTIGQVSSMNMHGPGGPGNPGSQGMPDNPGMPGGFDGNNPFGAQPPEKPDGNRGPHGVRP